MEAYLATHVGYTQWQEQRDIEGIVAFHMVDHINTIHQEQLGIENDIFESMSVSNTIYALFINCKIIILSFSIAQTRICSSHVDNSVCI